MIPIRLKLECANLNTNIVYNILLISKSFHFLEVSAGPEFIVYYFMDF